MKFNVCCNSGGRQETVVILPMFKWCPSGMFIKPIIYSIFIDELNDFMTEKFQDGVFTSEVMYNIMPLLFADDLILVADTPVKLQKRLDALHLYSVKWGMEISTGKTKVIVFKNGGPLSRYEHWMYNNKPLETVNAYKYLGLTITPKCVWSWACKVLSEQASKISNKIAYKKI